MKMVNFLYKVAILLIFAKYAPALVESGRVEIIVAAGFVALLAQGVTERSEK